MFGDPRQLHTLLKQMGVKVKELNVESVTIETDNKKIIIKPAQVVELNAKGTRTFSISGNITEIEIFNEEDVELVAQTAQVDKEKAKKALLQTNGNVADAIMLIEEGRI